MYDELRGNLMAQATHFSVHDETSLLLLKAADAIEELQKQLREEKVDNVNLTGWLAEEHAKQRWIPVTERLPEKTGQYLVCGQRSGKLAETWVCELIAFGKIKGWANDVRNPTVSHWMPLPQPPESEEA